MRLLSRWMDRLDAPRFCPADGEPIEVAEHDVFDGRTGARRSFWTWSCPSVHLTTDGGAIQRASQSGYVLHPYGSGRPRWHATQNKP